MEYQLFSVVSLALLACVSAAYQQPQYGAVQYHYPPPQPAHQPAHYAPAPAPAHYAAPVQYEAVPQAAYVVHEQPPVQYYAAPPVAPVAPAATHVSSGADRHGAYGQQASGHSVGAYGQQAAKAVHGARAYNGHAAHNAGGYGSQGSHADKAVQHGVYRNTGSYSRDQGSGYEKSYSFDKATGHHDISAENVAHKASQASASKQGHHDTASHAVQDQAKHGAHSTASGYGQSKQGYDKSVFDKYGYTHGGSQQGYSYSPVYGYGYH